MVYKLATGKMRSSSTLTTKKKPYGTATSGLTETVNAMIDHYLTAEYETTDSDYHILIRAQNKTPVKPRTTNRLQPQKFENLYKR